MSKRESIEEQLTWCKDARKCLEDFEYVIGSVGRGYDATTKELRNTSVFSEFLEGKMLACQESFREEMKKLWQQLHAENLDYIRQQHNRLQQELNNL